MKSGKKTRKREVKAERMRGREKGSINKERCGGWCCIHCILQFAKQGVDAGE